MILYKPLLLTFVALTLPTFTFASRFDHLVNPEFANPFTTDPAQIETEMQTLAVQLDQAIAELSESERVLLESKKVLESHGLTATDLMYKVHNLSESLSSDLRAAILSGKEIDDAKVIELRDMLSAAKREAEPFFIKLDVYIQDFLDLAMAIGYHSARYNLSKIPKTSKRYKTLKGLYKGLEIQRERYVKNKDQYGQPKDTMRTTPYNRFFRNLRELYIEASKVNEGRFNKWARRFSKLMRTYVEMVKKIPSYLMATPDFVRLVRVVYGVQQPTDHDVPLSRYVNKLMLRLAEINSVDIIVENPDNVPRDLNPGERVFLAASHRNALRDAQGIAKLGIDHIVFFAAVNNFVPEYLNFKNIIQDWTKKRISPKAAQFAQRWIPQAFNVKEELIKKLNNNNGLVVVGSGADPDPVSKMKRIDKEAEVPFYLLYPEGRLPEGFGASAGVRLKFAGPEGPLAQFDELKREGSLLPVTMRLNADLFGAQPLTLEPEIVVKVHPKIPSETRKLLIALSGPEGLAGVLRYGLLDELVTDEKLVFGQVRGSKLREVLGGYLVPNKPYDPERCKSLLDRFVMF